MNPGPAPDPNRLHVLIAAVAEGVHVDWDDELRRASPEDGTLIRSLRDLSRVAERNAVSLRRGDGAYPIRGVHGRLEFLEVLGTGSYGRVYHARDLVLERDVAVKVLDPSPDDDRTAEARRLAAVRHPNVVTVHDVAQVAGRPAVVMERLHGTTLDRYAREHAPLSVTAIAAIGTDLASALAAIHDAGLVHRDVKPQNVIREPSGRVVLMDLGAGVGSPRTMAPELFAGAVHSPASDIYSLGTLLYWLASGEYPVAGDTLDALHEAHRSGIVVPLADRRRELPAALNDAITRALSQDPKLRWADAASMSRALRGTADTPSRRRFRQPLALAGLAAAVVSAVLWSWPRSHEPERNPVGVAMGAYELEAAFYRGRGQRQVLGEGDAVAPGDSVSLVLRSSDDLYVYVLNEDDSGRVYLLFPAAGLSPGNPVPGNRRVVLPGSRGEEAFFWQVTSAAEHEDFLVVASLTPLPRLESELALLEPAREGTPVRFEELDPGAVRMLRGMGGLAGESGGAHSEDAEMAAGRFFDLARPLEPGSEHASGVWLRRLRLVHGEP